MPRPVLRARRTCAAKPQSLRATGGYMPALRLGATATFLAALLVGAQLAAQAKPPGTVDELAGLWKAHRSFGPFARGPLVIQRVGSTYIADMLGRTMVVRVDAGELSFELPGGQGGFRG